MNRCIFYGTLMDEQYNNKKMKDIYGEDSMKFISKEILPGFNLYDTRYGFPAAIRSDKNNNIIVEIFEVSDSCLEYIRAMELGSGYYNDIVKVGEDFCNMFLYREPFYSFTKIDSGSWIDYLETKKQIKNEPHY
jgi:gamma-glutamylcyclotransferase (GGCT)/AIG2-like uncharacterized protein YtfP